MKIDVTQVLNNWDGKPMMGEDDDGEKTPLRLRTVLGNALMFTAENERGSITTDTRAKRFLLAMDIGKYDHVNLKAKQVTELLALVNGLYPTAVVAAVSLILDPPEDEKGTKVPDTIPGDVAVEG